MTTRDKLIELLANLKIKREFHIDGNEWVTRWEDDVFDEQEEVEIVADAIIENGLFCDISKVGKLLSEMFGGDCPCNYGFGDEDVSTVVSEYDVEWCEQHCDDEEYDKCWTKFAEAKLKEQRQ